MAIHIRLLALTFIVVLAFPLPASALSKMWIWHETVYERQDIKTTVIQHGSGQAKILVRYSHGQQTAHGYFMATVVLTSGESEIGRFIFRKIVNPTGIGGTNVDFQEIDLGIINNQITGAKVRSLSLNSLSSSDQGVSCFAGNDDSMSDQQCVGVYSDTAREAPRPGVMFRDLVRQADFDPCANFEREETSLNAIEIWSCNSDTGSIKLEKSFYESQNDRSKRIKPFEPDRNFKDF